MSNFKLRIPLSVLVFPLVPAWLGIQLIMRVEKNETASVSEEGMCMLGSILSILAQVALLAIGIMSLCQGQDRITAIEDQGTVRGGSKVLVTFEGGGIIDMPWSPDTRRQYVRWHESAHPEQDEYSLLWINVETEQKVVSSQYLERRYRDYVTERTDVEKIQRILED